jgi:hypothetical protein
MRLVSRITIESETSRQADIQTDRRQIDRQTDTQTDRQTDSQSARETERESVRGCDSADVWLDRQASTWWEEEEGVPLRASPTG